MLHEPKGGDTPGSRHEGKYQTHYGQRGPMQVREKSAIGSDVVSPIRYRHAATVKILRCVPALAAGWKFSSFAVLRQSLTVFDPDRNRNQAE